MKPVSGKRMCKALERKGWLFSHTRGSHHIYRRPGSPFSLAVPVHGNQDMRTGTQHGLMRQAGLTDDDL